MRYDINLKNLPTVNLSVEMIRAAREVEKTDKPDAYYVEEIEDVLGCNISLRTNVLPNFREIGAEELIEKWGGKK